MENTIRMETHKSLSETVVSETTKDKYKKGIWRTKNDKNEPVDLPIKDMSTDHLLRALGYADKQAKRYSDLSELYVVKYQELIDTLKERNILEEDALKKILELPMR